jgi:hypothetical protein
VSYLLDSKIVHSFNKATCFTPSAPTEEKGRTVLNKLLSNPSAVITDSASSEGEAKTRGRKNNRMLTNEMLAEKRTVEGPLGARKTSKPPENVINSVKATASGGGNPATSPPTPTTASTDSRGHPPERRSSSDGASSIVSSHSPRPESDNGGSALTGSTTLGGVGGGVSSATQGPDSSDGGASSSGTTTLGGVGSGGPAVQTERQDSHLSNFHEASSDPNNSQEYYWPPSGTVSSGLLDGLASELSTYLTGSPSNAGAEQLLQHSRSGQFGSTPRPSSEQTAEEMLYANIGTPSPFPPAVVATANSIVFGENIVPPTALWNHVRKLPGISK